MKKKDGFVMRVMKGVGWFFAIFFGIGLLGSLLPKNTTTPVSYTPPQPKATAIATVEDKIEYSIIKKDDYSFSGRKRIKWLVYAGNIDNIKKRELVLRQVLEDCIEDTNVDQCHVFVEALPLSHTAGRGHSLAIGAYTPDGMGNSGEDKAPPWEIISISNKVFSDMDLKIIDLWYKYREKYKKPNGLTDERKLKKFIANELKVSVDKVSLPL